MYTQTHEFVSTLPNFIPFSTIEKCQAGWLKSFMKRTPETRFAAYKTPKGNFKCGYVERTDIDGNFYIRIPGNKRLKKISNLNEIFYF